MIFKALFLTAMCFWLEQNGPTNRNEMTQRTFSLDDPLTAAVCDMRGRNWFEVVSQGVSEGGH